MGGGAAEVEELSLEDNFVIKGNNLLALHSLKKVYAGKVKLIYIDPPYNTGGAQETFSYNNHFNRSTWLTFMKNRLEVAKKLLKENGFIAITIDHNELFYLGTLVDEIFGEFNRIGIVTIYINPKGRQHERFFSAATEYMLVYAKDISIAKFNDVAIDEDVARKFNLEDEKGKYRLDPLIRARTETLRKNKPNSWYPIYVNNDLTKVTLNKKNGYEEVYPIKNGKEFTWKIQSDSFDERNQDGHFVAKREGDKIKIYHKYREQQVLKNLWTDKKYFPEFQGTNLLKKLIGKNKFSYPKSLYAVLDTLKIMTKDDDIILDFFSGSGTTGHATLALNKEDGGNRRFILVEQLEKHIDITKERLNKVIEKGGNDSFTELKLMEYNQKYLKGVEAAESKEDLQKIWQRMQENAFLSYKVSPAAINKEKEAFDELSLDEQKQFLVEVLDKNQLYVNYSEIEDEEYGISEELWEKNRQFYSLK